MLRRLSLLALLLASQPMASVVAAAVGSPDLAPVETRHSEVPNSMPNALFSSEAEHSLPSQQDRIELAQNQQTNPSMARFDVRLTELEQELRSTTGRIEELQHQLRQLNERLDKLAADTDYRLSQNRSPSPNEANRTAAAPETGQRPSQSSGMKNEAVPGRGPTVLGSLPPSDISAAKAKPGSVTEPSPPGTSGDASQIPAAGTPREQYAQGYGLLRNGQYGQAEAAFKNFLAEYPNDPLTDNARYWLGETYYARGEYASAAETFLDGYQKSKNGPKAPDTLLKLGMSLASLDKINEACATYDELDRSIPDAPLSIKDKVKQERRRLSCK